MVLKVWGCVRISRVNAPGMERPTGNHSIINIHIKLLTVYTMKGEQSEPMRAAAEDVPTPMFL